MMKNVFGYDLQTAEYDGKGFIIRKTDCKITEYQEKLIVGTVKTEKRKRMPLWVKIIQYVLAFAVILVAFTAIMDFADENFARIFAAAKWRYIIAAVAAAGWLAIFIADKIMSRTAEKAPAFDDVYKVIEEEVYDKSYEKLLIPATAGVIDALSYGKNTENEKRRKKRPLYFNVETRIFTENGNLCLSDLEWVMAVPLEEITGVMKIFKTVKVGNWTKKEEYDGGRFKPYAVRKSKSGIYRINSYYRVMIDHAGEEFEFYVPCYDGATLKKYIDFEL